MKKTLALITFFTFLFCLTTVTADTYAADKIIDDWLFSQETITAKGEVYTIFIDLGLDSISLRDENGEYTKINLGLCKRIEDLGFCLQEIEYDFDEKDEKARIEVYDLEVIINVTREITDGGLLTGEETTLTVTLDNDGDEDVYLKFIDEFPKGIEVSKVSGGAKLENNIVTWEGMLRKNQDEEIEYEIRAVEDVDTTLVGRLVYEGEVYYTERIKLKSETVLETELNWEYEPLVLGDEIELNVTLKNVEEDEIEINNFTIYFPPELSVRKGGRQVTSYFWDGDIKEGSTKNLTRFEVNAQNPGISKIRTIANFDFQDKHDLIIKDEQSIEVKEPQIFIRIRLAEDGEYEYDGDGKVDALQTGKIKVDIQKSNPEINYTDLNINISGSAINDTIEVFLDKLVTIENERVASIDYVAPDVKRDTTYEVEVNVEFTTQYGDRSSEEEDYDIQVREARLVEVDHDIDPRSPEAGEETTIEVNLRNKRLQDLENVHVCTESDMPEIKKRCRKLNILSGSEITANAFEIKPPRVNETTDFIINTTLDYVDENRNYSHFEEKVIKVKPRELEPDIDMRVDDKDIPLGGETLVSYRIKNNEEETIKGLTLNFEPSQYFDIIGNTTYYVGNIDPDEELNLYDVHAVRAKKNETQKMDRTVAKFEDFYFGRKFEENSSQVTFKVTNSYFSGPMIIANKTAPSEVNESQFFTVVIDLENIGTRSQKVKFDVGGVEYEKDVYAGKTAQVSYEMKIDEPGDKQLVPKTVISYEYDGNKYTTATNDQKIKVKAKPKEKPKDPAIDTVKGETETFKTIKTTDERKPVIVQIIDFFKNLFGGE